MFRALMNATITGTRSSSCEGRIVNTFPCFSKTLLTLMSDRKGIPLAPMSEPTASNAALARSPDRPIMATVRGLASAPLTLATARSGVRLSSRIWSSSRRRKMPPDALMRSCSAFARWLMAATSPESKQRSLRELTKIAIESDDGVATPVSVCACAGACDKRMGRPTQPKSTATASREAACELLAHRPNSLPLPSIQCVGLMLPLPCPPSERSPRHAGEALMGWVGRIAPVPEQPLLPSMLTRLLASRLLSNSPRVQSCLPHNDQINYHP